MTDEASQRSEFVAEIETKRLAGLRGYVGQPKALIRKGCPSHVNAELSGGG